VEGLRLLDIPDKCEGLGYHHAEARLLRLQNRPLLSTDKKQLTAFVAWEGTTWIMAAIFFLRLAAGTLAAPTVWRRAHAQAYPSRSIWMVMSIGNNDNREEAS
jgi:hypothetical protein